MRNDQPPTNLEQLLDRIGEAALDGDQVSFGRILELVGRRSFAPLVLLAGLITVAPLIGDIPGVPTITGVFVVLIAGQLLVRREHVWLPRWLLKRSVAREKLRKALTWLRPPARCIDRFLSPRLTWFTHATGISAIAMVCVVIAAAMPAMEVVPLSANGAGAALTAFGLSLIAHDGLLALVAFVCTALTCGLAVYSFL